MFVHRHRHPEFWLPQSQPNCRVEIDDTHPLAQRLQFYIYPELVEGLPIELVRQAKPTDGAVTASASPTGVKLTPSVAPQFGPFPNIPRLTRLDGSAVFSYLTNSADGGGGAYKCYFVNGVGAGGSGWRFLTGHWTGSTVKFQIMGRWSGNGPAQLRGRTQFPVVKGVTWDQPLGTDNVCFYVDGVLGLVGSHAGYPVQDSFSTPIYIQTDPSLMEVSWHAIWDRILSAEENAWIAAEPWAFLRPEKIRHLFEIPAAGLTLDPAPLVAGAALDAGQFTQTHALDTAALAGAADLPAGTLTQTHALDPAALAAGGVITAGSLGQTHAMAAVDLAGLGILAAIKIGQGVLLDPAPLAADGAMESGSLTQTHALDPAGLAGAASLPGIRLPDRLTLEPVNLAGAGVMEPGLLSQTHQLNPAAVAAANDLAPGGLTQTHDLAALDLFATTALSPLTIDTELLGAIADPSIVSRTARRALGSATPVRAARSRTPARSVRPPEP